MTVNLVLDEKPARQDQKLNTLTKYVQKYPQGWKKRLELADLLYSLGSWHQATEQYQQVIERQPQLLAVRLKLGAIWQLIGKTAEAIEVYESALTLSCQEATRQHIYGLMAVCQGESQKAIIAFESAAALEPENPSHWLALGQVEMRKQNVVAALQAFEQILSLQPDDVVALMHSYDALIVLKNWQAAEEQLQKLIALAPKDLGVMIRQADRRCQQRLVFGAEGKQTKRLISAVLQQAPDAAEAHKLLAYYYIFRGNYDKGLGVLAQFTEQHPNNPSGWHYYKQCLLDTGKDPAASEGLTQKIQKNPLLGVLSIEQEKSK